MAKEGRGEVDGPGAFFFHRDNVFVEYDFRVYACNGWYACNDEYLWRTVWSQDAQLAFVVVFMWLVTLALMHIMIRHTMHSIITNV